MTSGYPQGPGWKEGDTSRDAAEDIATLAGRLRIIVYKHIIARPLRTADEIAYDLSESILTIRPRVSELRKMGWITNRGKGINRSGKAAHRWVAVNIFGADYDH